MFDIIFLICEVIISLVAIILLFFALLYYCATFIEERIKTITNFLKVISCIVLGLSVFLYFSEFSPLLFFTVFFTNLMFTIVLFNGFPFINAVRFDFIGGIMGSVFSHVLFMLHFLHDDKSSTFKTISYFVLFVWFIPIFVVTTLSALEVPGDEQNEHEEKKEVSEPAVKSQSPLKLFLSRMLTKAEEHLPHRDKKD
ncbi:Transmembrane adaptor Erv26 [Tritrichomonas foetus]|uniref:Transmembrane adaptor Erv26 n=1 Tax=Tritrichomonas foetus TaxID=1144522 RepID=A0A1J4JRA3_9EUKA|nr:Transmembrane adaptor Erv26 [Tritrichomonas foetus]|eukprot:OHT00038.1 Transmembrane adaptor Erv26 [Tritrichomonas foetus]